MSSQKQLVFTVINWQTYNYRLKTNIRLILILFSNRGLGIIWQIHECKILPFLLEFKKKKVSWASVTIGKETFTRNEIDLVFVRTYKKSQHQERVLSIKETPIKTV